MAKYSKKFIDMAKAVACHGHNIYDLTFEQASSGLIKLFAEKLGITKTDAKCLLLNTLVYNVVQEEIVKQAMFLLDQDKEDEED